MQRYYGVDIGDLWRGTLTLRRLWVLIDHLPVDSMAARRIASSSDHLAAWSLSDVLLGRLVDEIAALRWQVESALLGSKQRQRKPPTSVLPKPDDEQRVVPLVSPHTLGDFVNSTEGG